jgi:hypothetical protein
VAPFPVGRNNQAKVTTVGRQTAGSGTVSKKHRPGKKEQKRKKY